MSVLAAMADLESGRYDCALVVGVEQMRTKATFESQQALGAAAWVPRETDGVDYPWPQLFSDLGDEYERRYGLDPAHLGELQRMCFENARRNPNAQTRGWTFGERAFDADDEENPVVAGRIRRQDCSQVTDGAAAVVLASEDFCERAGIPARPACRGSPAGDIAPRAWRSRTSSPVETGRRSCSRRFAAR